MPSRIYRSRAIEKQENGDIKARRPKLRAESKYEDSNRYRAIRVFHPTDRSLMRDRMRGKSVRI